MQTLETRIRCRLNTKPQTPSRNLPLTPAIEAAMSGARQVHDALCAPPVQRLGNFEVATTTVPARYVSGDFVLSFDQKDSHFLVLGDLMGKGLSAAMWLTHVVDLIRRACEQEDSLPIIMKRLNYEMHFSRVGVPLTSLFLAKLDLHDARLTYCCGGCPAAFLVCADQSVKILDHGGPVLGALEESAYRAESFYLAPGQLLLAVSDGITEVHRGAEFELRPDRVMNHLRFTAGQSADSIVQSLCDRVRNSAIVLTDDLSILAIQRVA